MLFIKLKLKKNPEQVYCSQHRWLSRHRDETFPKQQQKALFPRFFPPPPPRSAEISVQVRNISIFPGWNLTGPRFSGGVWFIPTRTRSIPAAGLRVLNFNGKNPHYGAGRDFQSQPNGRERKRKKKRRFSIPLEHLSGFILTNKLIFPPFFF